MKFKHDETIIKGLQEWLMSQNKLQATMLESGNVYKVSIENKDDDVIMTFPDDMMDELGWQEDDELEFDQIGVLTDDGEYPSLCLVNKSLEERMKDEN